MADEPEQDKEAKQAQEAQETQETQDKTEYSEESEESEDEELSPVFTNPAISQSAPISFYHMHGEDGEVETDDSESSDEEPEKENTSPLHLSSIFDCLM